MKKRETENEVIRIMVVDDDDAVRDLIGAILSKEGYKVTTARTGAEAVHLAERILPNLIIMDIAMPEMDGYEATSRIRKIQALHEVPILFLTGRTAEEDAGRSFAKGATAFIRKPFSSKQIKDLVRLTLVSLVNV